MQESMCIMGGEENQFLAWQKTRNMKKKVDLM